MSIKVQIHDETLCVSGVKELSAANATAFNQEVRAALEPKLRHVQIDLSTTAFVDSCGLGALISLHKLVCGRRGILRLLNPSPQVMQILELTRMHRIFEIAKH